MRRIWKAGVGACVVGAIAVAACGDEGPTGVGSDLLGEGVRTYEVLFEANEFLVADTTYDGIGTLDDAPFRMAAHSFEGELHARTLFSLSRPHSVTYTAGGTTRTDSIAAVVGGTLTLVVDTIATSPHPIELDVLEVTEAWDRAAATWTVRMDTAGVTERWTAPGGSPGLGVAAGTWAGGDTLRITMDSAAVAVWADTLGAQLGGMIRATTPGARVFFHSIGFQFDVRPVGADTVLQAGAIVASKIIATPEAAAAAPGTLRVGGLPAWRSLLRFKPMGDVRIHCGPGQPAGCTIPLADATINTATVLLYPQPAGSRRVERPLRLEGRAVLAGPGVPVIRSPLTPPLGAPSDTLSPGLFATSPVPAEPVRLPVTGFVRAQIDPPTDDPPPEWLALTAVGERGQFGYATFGSITSNRPPRLRLVVSVPDAVLVR
jgi:hypothetical protein